MSMERPFEWKPGELVDIVIEKHADGFVVTVQTVEHGLHSAGPAGPTNVYAFYSHVGALELVSKCFAWDQAPSIPKFPDTFVHFDKDGPIVKAVFREWAAETRYALAQLSDRVRTLQKMGLEAAELAPWEAVLDELRFQVFMSCASSKPAQRPSGMAKPLHQMRSNVS